MSRTRETQGPRIRELPEIVKNQIAAGEVVERPASVVKELVENALDAGATEIQVDLEEGGVRLVRVVDDGSGMGPEDLELAFRSHATSKLSEVSDLDHIASLGFRGEALASIASVARCRIVSRPPERPVGHAVECEGGRIRPVVDAGGPKGTTIEARDLFYNTPARRRFLKRTSTELGRCLDVLQRIVIAQEGIGFVVTHDRSRVLDVERGMDRRARVRRVFGAELADALVPVAAEAGGIRVEGLLAPPRFSRRDTSRQMWFLNGRPLRDRILIRVLKDAYRGYQEDGRQPVAFLSLSMDPAAVDVNVHPQKSEVRFREERRLFGFLLNALREGLSRADVATPGERMIERVARRGELGASQLQPSLPDPGLLVPRAPWSAPRASSGEALEVREVEGRPFEPGEVHAPAPAGRAPSAWEAADDPTAPFLQIDRTYIVRAVPGGLEIVDQHALHERLTYEGLLQQFREGRVEVQRLLVPELVEVARSEASALEPHLEALARGGVELALFGPTTIAVQGLPALLRRPDSESIVRDLVARIETTGAPPAAEALVEELLHSRACRSSVMAGDPLDPSEVRALFARAARLENDQTCPHGRPTRVRFTLADLEKAFHRR